MEAQIRSVSKLLPTVWNNDEKKVLEQWFPQRPTHGLKNIKLSYSRLPLLFNGEGDCRGTLEAVRGYKRNVDRIQSGGDLRHIIKPGASVYPKRITRCTCADANKGSKI